MKSAQFIGELYQRTISHVRIDKRLISGASDFKIALFSGQYFAVDFFFVLPSAYLGIVERIIVAGVALVHFALTLREVVDGDEISLLGRFAY